MTKEKAPPRPPLDGQGCTPERKRHSTIKASVREITPGGMVLSYGDADTQHCYLDWLRVNGLLGSTEEDASVRYNVACRLRNIYYRFNSSGKAMTGEPGSSDLGMFEPDAITDADIAEQDFYDAMRDLPVRYRMMVREACIGDPRRFEITLESRVAVYEACEEIRDGLDALYRAFGKIDRKKSKNNSCTEH